MKKPVLALLPSAYKTNKVYSVLPVNGDGDFYLSRSLNATRVRKDGLIETVNSDVPRLDWLNSNCPSLLLEPQRTNLQIRSNQFDETTWIKSRATITANNTVSPNGELTADKLTGDGTGTSYVYDEIALTNGATYTISIFVKPIINISSFSINIFGGVGTASFDLLNKTLNSISGDFTSAKIEDYGNGWLRCSGTMTLSSSTGSKNIGYGLFNYNGNQFYLWGAQVEQGSCLTSYIETTTSPATRDEDVCGDAGNADLFSSNEGTMFVDIQKAFKDSSFGRISISDESTDNRVVIGKQSNNTQFRMFIERLNSGNVIAQHYPFLDFDVQNKLAITFKFGEFKFYVNGVLVSTETPNEDIPIGLSKFAFNENNLGSSDFFGEINDVRYYDRVLTEAEAIKLTT